MTATQFIPDAGKVYLDANVVIYAVEGIEPFASSVRPIFARVDQGQIESVSSELTLAEVLVIPLRNKLEAVANHYRDMLSTQSVLRVVPVSRDVLIQAAELRAAHQSLKLPDAIHAATALLSGCTSFLTNDSRFESVPKLPVVLLSKLGP